MGCTKCVLVIGPRRQALESLSERLQARGARVYRGEQGTGDEIIARARECGASVVLVPEGHPAVGQISPDPEVEVIPVSVGSNGDRDYVHEETVVERIEGGGRPSAGSSGSSSSVVDQPDSEAAEELAAIDWSADCDLLGLCLWQGELDSGNLVFSQGWEVLLGPDRAEWPVDCEGFLDRIHQRDRETAVDAHNALLSGEPEVIFEFRLIDAMGEIRWLESVGRRRGLDRSAVAGVTREITSQKAAERAARTSEARYRAVSELVTNHAYSFYLPADGGMSLEWVAGDFEAITGYPFEQAPTEGFWEELIHPEDRPIAEARAARLLAGREDTSEFRIITPDGRIRWLRDYGQPEFEPDTGRVIRIIGAAQDITEIVHRRREAQRMFELTSDLACVADFEGYLQRVNPAMLQTLGYSEQELLSQRVWEFLHPDDVPRARAFYQALVQQRSEHSRTETRFRCKDGSYRWLAWTSHVDFDMQRTYGLARDVTEERAQRQALIESEKRFHTLFEESPLAMLVLEPEGEVYRLAEVNQAAIEMVGDVLSEQIGRSVEALWPGREDICSRVYDCAKSSCSQVETEAPLPATTRHRILQMTFTAGSAGRVTIHIQDVTDSSRAREMQRIQRELALSVAATSDLGDALTSLAHCAGQMQGIDIVGICSWVEEEERFEVLAVEGMDEQLERVLRADPLPESILADGRLYSGQPIYGHMSDFLDIEGLTGELLDGLGGYSILPILDEGQLLATLNAVSRTYEQLPQSVRGPLESLVLRMGPVVGRIRMAHALEAERHAQQEANVTLRGVLARIEEEKAQTARSVASNVDHHILPLLDEFDHHLRSPDQQRLLKLLRAHLDEVTGSHTEKLRRTIEGLTPTELRVCDMIRRGLASKEIARVLHISPVTVSRHRDNIRKKLDLVGKKVNLASYLRSIDLDVDRS